MSVDERVLCAARTWGHTPARDRVIGRFSRLGEHAGVWLAIGLVGGAVEPARREHWGQATATVAATYALNTAIKLLVRRERPQLAGLPALSATPTRLSFPSAHASTAFAGAYAFSRLGLPRAPLYALAAKLSWSRLYLGVHYPSDVLAGALFGTAFALGRERALGERRTPAARAAAAASAPSSNGHGPQPAARPAEGRQ